MSEQQYRRTSPSGDSQAEMHAEVAKAEGQDVGTAQGEPRYRPGLRKMWRKKNWWEKLNKLHDVFGQRESPHRGGHTVTMAVRRKRRNTRKARNKRERQARKAMREHGVL